MKKQLIIGISALTMIAASGMASAAPIELVFAISAKPGSTQHNSAEEFTKRVNSELAGKVKVKFFGASSLGKDKDLMQKLKLGTVHFAMPSSMMSSIAGEAGLFDMPFLVKDRKHVKQIEEKVFWDKIHPAIQKKGYTVIGFWENGVRHITNNVRPINTPADLDGVKLRTPKSTWRIKMFKEWGANPTPMAFSEVFVALQTGVIDGQENPYTNIYAAKLNEVQKYLSVTGHVYSPSYLTTGTKAWMKLPEDIRKDLKRIATDVQMWTYEDAAKDESALFEKLKNAGMTVNTADRAAFVEASKPIYAMFAKEVNGGEALVDAALALAK